MPAAMMSVIGRASTEAGRAPGSGGAIGTGTETASKMSSRSPPRLSGEATVGMGSGAAGGGTAAAGAGAIGAAGLAAALGAAGAAEAEPPRSASAMRPRSGAGFSAGDLARSIDGSSMASSVTSAEAAGVGAGA